MTLLETLTPVAATGALGLAWLLIAIPLAVAGILLVVGRAGDSWGHLLGAAAPVAAFVIALTEFVQLLGAPAADRAASVPVYTWAEVGGRSIEIGLLVDPLSILFALLVTGVGSLIFIYSIGYMAEDPKRRRFFAFLNIGH